MPGGTGGSIESVSLDGNSFSVASDADSTRKLGGFENEKQSNGDGTVRTVKTRVPWSLAGLTLDVNDAQGEHELLQELSDRVEDFPITITYPSGVTMSATGGIVSELSSSSGTSLAAVELAGGGKLASQ